jgi:hypothetical protein
LQQDVVCLPCYRHNKILAPMSTYTWPFAAKLQLPLLNLFSSSELLLLMVSTLQPIHLVWCSDASTLGVAEPGTCAEPRNAPSSWPGARRIRAQAHRGRWRAPGPQVANKEAWIRCVSIISLSIISSFIYGDCYSRFVGP